MIKSRNKVELVTYECDALEAFRKKCKDQGRGGNNFWCDVSGEIANDLQWVQENDMFGWTGKDAIFSIIPISRSVEEIIAVIEETVSNYDLEEYF